MFCLIVESDPAISMAWEACLFDMGLEVAIAVSVTEALRVLRQRQVDLVLLNHTLGAETTEPVALYIQHYAPNARLILITGTGAFPRGEARRYMPGVDWVLRQPVVLNDLRALVEYAVRDMRRDAAYREPQRQRTPA
ncbi:Response regulator receiver domain-containing protein [Poseidonocella pacifica]|uniref:Response regulator receiver domain-containing protein n=1 Tax=Poseidonocella pacifica TaxID=871651 RepID=A0A1I0VWX7_9RHOB|nr:response regulator [Poseidonocella pacifica]SFA80166.1 Response regulator receiver domain-containing protein [Poseidonocella pacifica]